jgi:hypothetical protein
MQRATQVLQRRYEYTVLFRSLWRRYHNSSSRLHTRAQLPPSTIPRRVNFGLTTRKLSRLRSTPWTSRPVQDDEPTVEDCGSSRRSARESSDTLKHVYSRSTSFPARFLQFTIHLLLSVAHPTYHSYTSPSFLRGSSALERVHDLSVGNLEVPPSSVPRNHTDPNRRKANAVFVVLGEFQFCGVETL